MTVSGELMSAVGEVSRLLPVEGRDAHILSGRIYLELYAMRRRRLPKVAPNISIAMMDRQFVNWATRPFAGLAECRFVPTIVSIGDELLVEIAGVKAGGSFSGIGDGVMVSKPPVYLNRSPGFMFHASGVLETNATTRIYLALRARHARAYFDNLRVSLTRALPAFAMKALSNPANYSRNDAGVIYVARQERKRAMMVVSSWAIGLAVPLRRLPPLGTCQFDRGLGWADSPILSGDTEVSYGQWLTSLLIDAAKEFGSEISTGQLARLIEERGRRADKIWDISADS